MEKCKSLLRKKVYWPSLEADVNNHIGKCTSCIANTNGPNPQPIRMSELPKHPWEEVEIDFYGPIPSGKMLLVIEDLYSRFPFIEIMKTTSASNLV